MPLPITRVMHFMTPQPNLLLNAMDKSQGKQQREQQDYWMGENNLAVVSN